jgi:ribosomal protein S18 acetylase RimI-like enzyme
MEVTKRPARETDTDFARSVHHQAYRDVSVRQFGPWDEMQQDEYFKGDWTSADFEIVLCDGIACGYMCVEDGEHVAHVRELVLLPEFQGRGIGSSLLREVMERASRRGVPVRLETFYVNRALNLYRRLGFQEIGRTETHILMEWNGEKD